MRKNVRYFCLGFLVMLMLGTCGVIEWGGDYLGDEPNGEEEPGSNGGGGGISDGECEMITNANAYSILQDNNGNNFKLDGKYCLGEDIDLSSLSQKWEPLATFTGSLDGRGNTISGLTINEGSIDTVGFFKELGAGAIVKDLSFSQPNVTGRDNVGVLAGISSATAVMTNLQITGSGTIASGSTNIGGLVGTNGGTIQSSYTTGAVDADYQAGGLVGENTGAIENSHAVSAVSGGTVGGLVGWNRNSGTIKSSYATGTVDGDYQTGGLVGINDSAIENSYAEGAASGGTAGGLAGLNYSIATITNSYATGAVSGSSTGGLVGYNQGAVTSSYYDKISTGQSDTGQGLGVSEKVNIGYSSGKYYDNGVNPRADIFVNWDPAIWTFATGKWPTLAWQNP